MRAAGAAVLLVLVAAAWVGVRGWQARGHLLMVADLVPRIEAQALAGHVGDADLRRLQHESGRAAALTGDPVWTTATHLPWLGDDLRAVRESARAVDEVARGAVPSLALVATRLNPAALRPEGGRFDLAPLRGAQEPLRRADVSVASARERVAPLVDRSSSLVGPVRRAVVELDATLTSLSSQVSTGHRAADLLPSMLGQDGRRRYLVVFQNLAEARSLGGIAGAFAVVEADHGAVRIVRQGTAADVPRFADPVLRLSVAEQRLYQRPTTTFFQNVTQPVDFSVAARIARAMWERTSGTTIDGVVATDPVALSYLLAATGPVQVPAGGGQKVTLTSENAVRLLLSDVYARFTDPADQNAFFAAAAVSVFQSLMAGPGDPGAVLDQLARAAGERRLLVWSDHEDEQRSLQGTVLAGDLPTRETSRPTVGVFFNAATASKMSYYLTTGVQVRGGECRRDGQRSLKVDVALSSHAPERGLTWYVAGRVKPYTVSTVLYLVSPVGGGAESIVLDGLDVPANTQVVGDRTVSVVTVDLRPGEAKVLSITFASPDIPGSPRLTTSPTVSGTSRTVTLTPC